MSLSLNLFPARAVVDALAQQEAAEHEGNANTPDAPPPASADQPEGMADSRSKLLSTMLSNLANMRHEMLKSVAQNLRA